MSQKQSPRFFFKRTLSFHNSITSLGSNEDKDLWYLSGTYYRSYLTQFGKCSSSPLKAKGNTTWTLRIDPNIQFYYGNMSCESVLQLYTSATWVLLQDQDSWLSTCLIPWVIRDALWVYANTYNDQIRLQWFWMSFYWIKVMVV